MGKGAIGERRRRRLIWNDDGDDLRAVAFGLGEIWTPNGMIPVPDRFDSVERFLDLRLAAIARTPVDVISYCGVFTWPIWEFPPDRIRALGPDPLLHVVEFAHRHGKEFFFNIRLNDCHPAGPHWSGPAYWDPFRQAHPELLNGRFSEEEWRSVVLPWAQGTSPVYPLQAVLERSGPQSRELLSWATYDYAHVEVRDRFLGLIREACERTDLDGIDLDFLRAPFYFRAGEERRNAPLMNDFVRSASDLIRRAARKRGRTIALCVRVPDSPRRALEIGLDVAHWIEEGWIDLVVAGNGLAGFSMPFSPWVESCAPRGVPLLACLSRSAPALAKPETFLGACQRSWMQGVDGLYFFNHFIPHESGWLGRGSDLRMLSAESKEYALDSLASSFENGTSCEGPLPMAFIRGREGTSARFALEIPESTRGAADLRLRVVWSGAVREEEARWTVNGKPVFRAVSPTGEGLEFGLKNLDRGVQTIRLDLPPTAIPAGETALLESLSVRIVR